VGWFDGATHVDGLQSGAGGIIKISESTVYKWTFNTGPSTNNIVELLGVRVTLFLASRLHITDLQIIGDSKIIIDCAMARGDYRSWRLTDGRKRLET
jgi:ribonuclease HI